MAKPVTIIDVRTFLIQASSAATRFIIVKVVTSEPGLYGLGCATFTQRFRSVAAAINDHLRPFALGRDVDRIEEFFQMAMVQGSWRNGPVLNNAVSGIEQALWDIKGKRANLPVCSLLGGRCREGAAVYAHADGRDPQEVVDNVRKFMELGYHYVRVQMGGYGGSTIEVPRPEGAPDRSVLRPARLHARHAEDDGPRARAGR